MVKNLWGTLDTKNMIRTPLSIMKEQCSLLAEATNGIVYAEVDTSDVTMANNRLGGSSGILHRFYVVAPALNNYRFDCFRVVHSVLLYPASAYCSFDEELSFEAQTEQEFEAGLGQILASAEMHKIIGSLLSQSR